MTVAFIADVHVANHRRFGGGSVAGVNRRAQLCLDALRAAVKAADEAGATTLFVLGDLFDSDVPSPALIAGVGAALLSFSGQVVLLPGNHDRTSDASGHNAMAPLALLPGVTVVEHVMLIAGVTIVPIGQPFPANARVLAAHVGIEAKDSPEYLRGTGVTAEALDAAGASLVLAGDWHRHRVHHRAFKQAEYVQVGALCPTGFDNPGIDGYGSLIVLDVETLVWKRRLVPSPRFQVVRVEDLEQLSDLWIATPSHASTLFVRAVSSVELLSQTHARLAEVLSPGTFEVVPSKSAVQAIVEHAARAARSADTIYEAIDRYVRTMSLPPAVDRTALLAQVLEFMRR